MRRYRTPSAGGRPRIGCTESITRSTCLAVLASSPSGTVTTPTSGVGEGADADFPTATPAGAADVRTRARATAAGPVSLHRPGASGRRESLAAIAPHSDSLPSDRPKTRIGRLVDRPSVRFFIVHGLAPSSTRTTLQPRNREVDLHVPSPSLRNEGRRLGRRPSFLFVCPTCGTMPAMEITWFGASCVRLKGREGVVAADPFRSVVGPTGRGITADIVSFGYPDEAELVGRGARSKAGVVSRQLGVPLPTSLESAYVLDSPGEFEVHDVMVTGVRTYPRRGARRQARRQHGLRVRAGRHPHGAPWRRRTRARR